MAASDKTEYCFPISKEFREKFYKELSRDQYLAEKTWPTIDRWLSDKCVFDHSLVPLYAISDYEDTVCKKSDPMTCSVIKMNSTLNYNAISDALNRIGIKKTIP